MLVDKNIVEIIIGKLLIDPDIDEDDLNTRQAVLKIFSLQQVDHDDGEQNVNDERYLVSIHNLLQLHLSWVAFSTMFKDVSRY